MYYLSKQEPLGDNPGGFCVARRVLSVEVHKASNLFPGEYLEENVISAFMRRIDLLKSKDEFRMWSGIPLRQIYFSIAC
jgi:hypothetical protein